ncbi:hypothetical protein [Streptomyces sp. Isolate_219]|uniref:hypothetical protein n=1 Tax=Streptomyces sp. Isolate_219 TaxID=2950110 RepID=UPI0021C76466|nr:hypothetical protein [Streptomyces sp. Isolate_219]MCR8574700.1 hypothetical protein [Streptomyces sp. Isolate_219]
MDLTPAAGWAVANPWPASITAAAVAAAVAIAARRLGHAVLVAAIGAMVCTAYSADTSWRFAEHRLGMHDTSERIVMFAAAEIALIACGLLARATKNATATDDTAGTAGVPGILVWVITGVQIIPAYSESGFVGGTVRAIIGPVMAGLLWHQAMGLEIRVIRPGALSTGLPAMIGRELRERLLSHLGLAVRDRSAEQIARDRALARAVRLGSRKRLFPWGRKRCAAALTRARVATDPTQRHRLMLELAARRGAPALTTIALPSLWEPPQEPAQPRTMPALAHQELAELHPIEAVRRVHSAHPGAHPAELASIATAHGVVVSEQMVRIAIGAGNPPPHPTIPAALDAAPTDAPRGPLVLDVVTEPEVHPEVRSPAPAFAAGHSRDAVHARIPECAPEGAPEAHDAPPACEPEPAADAHPEPEPECAGEPDAHPDASADPGALPTELIEQARALGRPASLRTLKKTLRVGQSTAQRLQKITRGD